MTKGEAILTITLFVSYKVAQDEMNSPIEPAGDAAGVGQFWKIEPTYRRIGTDFNYQISLNFQ